MKYAIIPYIALGLVLSLFICIEYRCEGQEIFPIYYGSPFIFKQASIGSSIEYFYSISGLILNILVWSFLLFTIDKAMQIIIKQINSPKWICNSYKIIIGFMIAFTTLNITIGSIMIGRGFDKHLNYWYWDINKEAKTWGVTCKGKIVAFRKSRVCYKPK